MSSGHTSPESMRTNDENARDFAACHGTRALPSVGVLQISQPSDRVKSLEAGSQGAFAHPNIFQCFRVPRWNSQIRALVLLNLSLNSCTSNMKQKLSTYVDCLSSLTDLAFRSSARRGHGQVAENTAEDPRLGLSHKMPETQIFAILSVQMDPSHFFTLIRLLSGMSD